jgi:hypothetical protein
MLNADELEGDDGAERRMSRGAPTVCTRCTLEVRWRLDEKRVSPTGFRHLGDRFTVGYEGSDALSEWQQRNTCMC